MIIPRKDRKRIIMEFVGEIMNKLKVPEEEWSIRYTSSLLHPTSYVQMGNRKDWRRRDIEEAIKYAYLKDYIKTDIVQVPQVAIMKNMLDRSSTGVLSEWTDDDNAWLLIYLLEKKGIYFWMREGEDSSCYLIYKVIKYDDEYYIAVLNTYGGGDLWCNLYPAQTTNYPKQDATIPIVITPFRKSNLPSFINWTKNTSPWEGVK